MKPPTPLSASSLSLAASIPSAPPGPTAFSASQSQRSNRSVVERRPVERIDALRVGLSRSAGALPDRSKSPPEGVASRTYAPNDPSLEETEMRPAFRRGVCFLSGWPCAAGAEGLPG